METKVCKYKHKQPWMIPLVISLGKTTVEDSQISSFTDFLSHGWPTVVMIMCFLLGCKHNTFYRQTWYKHTLMMAIYWQKLSGGCYGVGESFMQSPTPTSYSKQSPNVRALRILMTLHHGTTEVHTLSPLSLCAAQGLITESEMQNRVIKHYNFNFIRVSFLTIWKNMLCSSEFHAPKYKVLHYEWD